MQAFLVPGAVEALKALSGRRTAVILSNALVRYAIVPDDPAVSAPEEEIALARFHFAKIYGEAAKGWDIRLCVETRLASAVDAGLVQAIRAACPSVASIQPYLMAAFNASRKRLAGKPAWLVLPEGERVCLAYASQAGWHAVRFVRDEWQSALARERLRLGIPSPDEVLVLPCPPVKKESATATPPFAQSALTSPLNRGARP